MKDGGFMDDRYGLVEPILSKLYTSKLRLGVLFVLERGQMGLADLSKILNSDPPNTASKIKDLMMMGLVRKDKGGYELTEWGNAVKECVVKTVDTISAYEGLKDYWAIHDIGGIPKELVGELGTLKDSKLLSYTVDISDINSELGSYLLGIEEFAYIASPILVGEWVRILLEKIKKEGIKFSSITTRDVISKSDRIIGEKAVRWFDTSHVSEEYEIDGLKVAFIASDKFFGIRFPLKSMETIDNNATIVNESKEAIVWGVKLFNYYKERARPVKSGAYYKG